MTAWSFYWSSQTVIKGPDTLLHKHPNYIFLWLSWNKEEFLDYLETEGSLLLSWQNLEMIVAEKSTILRVEYRCTCSAVVRRWFGVGKTKLASHQFLTLKSGRTVTQRMKLMCTIYTWNYKKVCIVLLFSCVAFSLVLLYFAQPGQ